MKTCRIVKDGKKWYVVSETDEILYTGKTRKSCFKFTWDKELKILSFQKKWTQVSPERVSLSTKLKIKTETSPQLRFWR